jgi:tetratricopeptide (TPR) repeat protein
MINNIQQSLVILLILLLSCSPYSLPEPRETQPREDAFAYYQESLQEYDAGKYQSALDNIQKAINIHQNFAKFYKVEGDIYKRMAKYDQALVSYENAVNQRSNFLEVHKDMGEIYFNQENYEDAIRSFRKVLILEPKETQMYLKIAQCFIVMDELDIALNNLNDYIQYENSYSKDYYLLKGIAYYNLQRYPEVIAELKQFYSSENTNSDIFYLLGRSYYGINEYEEGLRCFNKLIQLDASNGEYYYYRGIYFFIKMDYNDAESQFKYALQLDKTLGKAHYYLGKIYGLRLEVDKALAEFTLYRESDKRFEEDEDVSEVILQLENLHGLVSDSTKSP